MELPRGQSGTVSVGLCGWRAVFRGVRQCRVPGAVEGHLAFGKVSGVTSANGLWRNTATSKAGIGCTAAWEQYD
ncbi:hypothetical protein E2C01_020792 [Portunus trituberculatus]|uniref:Uncharacterized protein n=1 Tax=Portunus trituberculatus TaxID=210409 RepID=A0A5B7E2R5_PORTR|nr:hypothetical protein [Portunus trituberculatus]